MAPTATSGAKTPTSMPVPTSTRDHSSAAVTDPTTIPRVESALMIPKRAVEAMLAGRVGEQGVPRRAEGGQAAAGEERQAEDGRLRQAGDERRAPKVRSASGATVATGRRPIRSASVRERRPEEDAAGAEEGEGDPDVDDRPAQARRGQRRVGGDEAAVAGEQGHVRDAAGPAVAEGRRARHVGRPRRSAVGVRGGRAGRACR